MLHWTLYHKSVGIYKYPEEELLGQRVPVFQSVTDIAKSLLHKEVVPVHPAVSHVPAARCPIPMPPQWGICQSDWITTGRADISCSSKFAFLSSGDDRKSHFHPSSSLRLCSCSRLEGWVAALGGAESGHPIWEAHRPSRTGHES